MSAYTPDNWVIIKFNMEDTFYKVLAGWSGGYATGDSWQLNSGITRVEEDDNYFYFYGASGSCYQCNKGGYCLRANNAYVWDRIQVKAEGRGHVELMPEDTDWMSTDWVIGEHYS